VLGPDLDAIIGAGKERGVDWIERVVDRTDFSAQFLQFLCQLRVVIEITADRSLLSCFGSAKLNYLPRLEEDMDGSLDVLATSFPVIRCGLVLVHVDLFAFSDPLLARYWGRETGQCKPSPPFKRFRRIAAY
jgi:hypothetical protein